MCTQDNSIPLECFSNISENAGSFQAIQWIRSQLAVCSSSPDHASCQSERIPRLPARVLELVGPTQVRLHVSKQNEAARYACLSHCWGSVQPLKTTRETIENFQRSIPWQDLPQTFRDAITVVDQLGLKYLWIDSLTIVQDDIEDWRLEGSKMAEIYRNSYVTISATSASCSNSGLFFDTPLAYRGRPIRLQRSNKKVYVRES